MSFILCRPYFFRYTLTNVYDMTFGGICLMVLMCGFFTGLFFWCIGKVVRTPGETEHIHPTAYEQIPDPEPFEREQHKIAKHEE